MFTGTSDDYVSAVNKVSQAGYDLNQFASENKNPALKSSIDGMLSKYGALDKRVDQFTAGSPSTLDIAKFNQDAAIFSNMTSTFIRDNREKSQIELSESNKRVMSTFGVRPDQYTGKTVGAPKPSVINWPLFGVGIASLIAAGILWFKKRKAAKK